MVVPSLHAGYPVKVVAIVSSHEILDLTGNLEEYKMLKYPPLQILGAIRVVYES